MHKKQVLQVLTRLHVIDFAVFFVLTRTLAAAAGHLENFEIFSNRSATA